MCAVSTEAKRSIESLGARFHVFVICPVHILRSRLRLHDGAASIAYAEPSLQPICVDFVLLDDKPILCISQCFLRNRVPDRIGAEMCKLDPTF